MRKEKSRMINNTIYCIKYIWKIDRKYILLMIVISILTRACMCRNGIAFSSALGDSDNCSNCGCNCLPWNHGSNASTASNADRASV